MVAWSLGAAYTYDVGRQPLKGNGRFLRLVLIDVRVVRPMSDWRIVSIKYDASETLKIRLSHKEVLFVRQSATCNLISSQAQIVGAVAAIEHQIGDDIGLLCKQSYS